MRVMRLAIVAGAVAAMALAGTASANAASTSCNAGGLIKLSPGLGTEAQVQNVTVKGTLSGCESSESKASEGKFDGALQDRRSDRLRSPRRRVASVPRRKKTRSSSS